jgi:2'-5' RNA ligase
VQRYQDVLRDLDELDMVPPGGLHLTLARVGWTDEVSEALALRTAARLNEASLPPVTTTTSPARISPGAVVLDLLSAEAVMPLYEQVTAAVCDELEQAGHELPHCDFWPHVSLAYPNRVASTEQAAQRLAELPTPEPVPVRLEGTRLVRLWVERGRYGWEAVRPLTGGLP